MSYQPQKELFQYPGCLHYFQYYGYNENYWGNAGNFYEYSSINRGHWTVIENLKYYAFLKKFSDKFAGKQKRRECKVFKILAEFIETRDANQCRSHHHKMHKSNMTVEDTLFYLQIRFSNIDKKAQRYFEMLENPYLKQSFELPESLGEKNQKIKSQDGKIFHHPQVQISHFSKLKKQQIINLKADNIDGVKKKETEEKGEKQNNNQGSPVIKKPDHIKPETNPGGCHYGEFIIDRRLQNLKQCHSLFMKWWQKLESLIKMQSEIQKI